MRPVNSHINKFERELNHAIVGTKVDSKERWYNAKKHKKTRILRTNSVSMKEAMHVIFAQTKQKDMYVHVSVHKGVMRHGELAFGALFNEFGQIHQHGTCIPQMVDNLTFEQRKEVLNLITMIKERCGKVKVRTCVDGGKQHSYI